MADRDEFGAFLIGFVIGGLTGAAVSLMLAPQSGEETRTYLRDRAIELKDKASESAQTAMEQAEAAAADARARIEELAELAKTKTEDLQHQGTVVLEEGKTKVTEVISSVSKKAEPPAAPAAEA